MSNYSHTIACITLFVFCIVTIPPPSSGFGMLGGGNRGSSAVAEILAAGLITGLLMDQSQPMSRPVFQAILHPMMEYMMPMHQPQHHMHPMMGRNMHMMHPYGMASMHQPQYFMNQALMVQASQQQAIAARLNEEIKALEAQESMLEAYLARNQQGAAQSALRELLSDDDEDVIPAAALILETAEIMEDEEEAPQAPSNMRHPEMIQMATASSEPESRYILPRIVRHFVQRIMRRAEHH